MLQAIRNAPGQAWRVRSVFAYVLLPTVGLLVLVAVAAAIADVDIGRLTRDPLAVLEAPPLTGFLSNVGIVLWSAAAGACFLAALALRRRGADGEATRFYFWSGALTTLLVLDDLFQVHEEIVPGLFGRGHTQILVGYVAVTALYVWRFRRALAATEYVLLVAAGFFYALSLAVDLLPLVDYVLPGVTLPDPDSADYGGILQLVEDGAKLIGIAFWLAFFLRSAAGALAPRADRPASTTNG